MEEKLKSYGLLVSNISTDSYCYGCSLIGVNKQTQKLCCNLFREDLEEGKPRRIEQCLSAEKRFSTVFELAQEPDWKDRNEDDMLDECWRRLTEIRKLMTHESL